MGRPELSVRLVEIVMRGRVRVVPRDIHIVEGAVYLHDVPGMILPREASTVIARDVQQLHHILERPGITGTDAPSAHQRTVRALVHGGAHIIFHQLHQRVMDISLLLYIAPKALGLGHDGSGSPFKGLPCLLQRVRGAVVFQGNLHTAAAAQIFTGISRLQPEQLRMVVVHCLEHGLQLTNGHSRHRRECRGQLQRIGVYLAVYLLHVRFQHGIIGILLLVKGKAAAGLSGNGAI